jgi:hypothetical protein
MPWLTNTLAQVSAKSSPRSGNRGPARCGACRELLLQHPFRYGHAHARHVVHREFLRDDGAPAVSTEFDLGHDVFCFPTTSREIRILRRSNRILTQGYRLIFSATPLGSFSHRGAFSNFCDPSGVRTQHWSFSLWVDPRGVTENRIRVGRTCSTPAGSQKQQTWCGMYLEAIARTLTVSPVDPAFIQRTLIASGIHQMLRIALREFRMTTEVGAGTEVQEVVLFRLKHCIDGARFGHVDRPWR